MGERRDVSGLFLSPLYLLDSSPVLLGELLVRSRPVLQSLLPT